MWCKDVGGCGRRVEAEGVTAKFQFAVKKMRKCEESMIYEVAEKIMSKDVKGSQRMSKGC
jgi:hypothetical protein